MKQLVAKPDTNALQLGKLTLVLPALIIEAGKPTAKRFVEFFTANIRTQPEHTGCLRANGTGFLRLV